MTSFQVGNRSILGVLLVLICIFNLRCFYLIDGDWIWMAPVTLLGIGIFWTRCKFPHRRDNHKLLFLNIYTIFFCVILFFLSIYTWINFPVQGLKGTIRVALYYVPFLAVYIILGCFYYDRNFRKVFHYMEIMTLIWMIIVFIQRSLYPIKGILLIENYFTEESLSLAFSRKGTMRIGLIGFTSFMVIYAFFNIYVVRQETKNKWLHITVFLLGIYELIFVSQTRSLTAIICGCMMMIIFLDKNTRFRFIRKIILVLLAGVILIKSGIISIFIASFGNSSNAAYSTTARLYAIHYYGEYFKSHPLFGMGLVSGFYYPEIVTGPMGFASLDDVGIIGQLMRLGVFVVPIYIYPVFRICYIAVKVKNKILKEDVIFLAAYLFFLLGTSINLIMLDPQRIIMWPLTLAVFEYIYMETKEKNIKEYLF